MQTTNLQSWAVSEEDLFAGLNPQQLQAVRLQWGPALIVAGAGSGKTTVLTRRVAYLLSQLTQPASSIMAVTFTNKAAAEMKTRLEKMVGPTMSKRLAIGTFHSICARLLRREIVNYKTPEGYTWKSNFVIYDETDSLNVIKGVVQRLNLDEKVFAPRDVRNKISALKNDGNSSYHYAQEARNYQEQRLSDIFSQYQSELARNNAMDFDDLISTFTHLLESNPEVRARLNDQYRHLLVDEFQDTNQAQYRLVRLLTTDESSPSAWDQRTLLVVGDVDQSIYSWRKADFRIFLGFQKDFKETTLIKLEENYRSTETILEVANSIIVNNSERLEKELRCNRGPGGKVKCYPASDEVDEAFFVVEELKRIAARGLSLSDCCLLYRTNAQSRAIEEVLVRSGIPYTMVGGTRFYDRAEIKDVVAYLKVVYNADDGQSFLRIVNTPRRGLGKTSLDRLAEHAATCNISLFDAAMSSASVDGLSPKTVKTLFEFASNISRWNNMAGLMGVSGLLQLVLKESNYLHSLEQEAAETKDEVVFGRIENIRELVRVAEEFEATADEPDLESFLTRISLVSDLDSVNMDQQAVKLMTLHSAKGLEFPTVFMMGLEEGLFPHIRSLDSPSALEEERRLMYVGVTRAQDRLYLTFSRKRMSFINGNNSSNYSVPSRFLSEIKRDCIVGFQPDPESAFRAESSSFGGNSYDQGYSRQGSSGGYGNSGGYGGNSSRQGGGYGSGGRQGSSGYNTGSRSSNPPASSRPGSGGTTPPPAKPRVLSRRPAYEQGETAGPSEPAVFEKLVVGDKVMHTKFGVGVITQVIGEKDKELYNVEFQAAGKRLMDPRFAKLVKLD